MVGHRGITMSKRGAEQKLRHLTATATQVASGTELWARDHVLEYVDTFKYLVIMMSFNESNLSKVAWNLHIARMRWGQLSRMLCQEGADTTTSG